MALALVATIVIARISWTYFEKPLLAIGRRQRYEPQV
jgi:peptidoglycan/LPS O-acetylase OafA/YrhL